MASYGKRFVSVQQGWNPWDYPHWTRDSWDSRLSKNDIKQRQSKSIRKLCSDFADDTSLNGIAFLKHATNKWTRVFWAVFLLFMTGMVFYQLVGVFEMFLANGFNTVMELKNAKDLAFPSVTVCNVNPMQKSLAKKMSPEMQEFLKKAKDNLPTGVNQKPPPNGPSAHEPPGPTGNMQPQPSGPQGPTQNGGPGGAFGPRPQDGMGPQGRTSERPIVSTNDVRSSESTMITNNSSRRPESTSHDPRQPQPDHPSPTTQEPLELETSTPQMNDKISITASEDPSTFSSFSSGLQSGTIAKSPRPSQATMFTKTSTMVTNKPETNAPQGPSGVTPSKSPGPTPPGPLGPETQRPPIDGQKPQPLEGFQSTSPSTIQRSTLRTSFSQGGSGPRGPLSEDSRDTGQGKDGSRIRVKRQSKEPKPKPPEKPIPEHIDKDYRQHFEDKKNSFFASTELSDEHQTYSEFLELYGNMEIDARREIGVQIEDMLFDCSYGGSKCSVMNFTHHLSPKFGNCYTFNGFSDNQTKPIRIFQSGKKFGLELSLFVNVYEYIPAITDGYGAVVVIHPFDTLPMPEQSGLMVSPGFETNFAIRLVNISRLGEPYNTCSLKGNFTELFQHKYTNEACLNTCVYITIVETCGCYKAPFESFIPSDWIDKFPKCSSNQSLECAKKTETLCALGILGKTCQCDVACSEQVYEVTSTSIAWPHRSLYAKIATDLCQISDEACKKITCSDDDIDRGDCEPENVSAKDLSEALKENVLKLKIYYAELNYQQLFQTPEYTVPSFGADIGGTIGLWLGFSVVTGMEIIQFIIKLFYRCMRNSC